MKTDYLESVRKQFEYYKMLGDKTMDQLPDAALHWRYNEESNSIATIIKHLSGNMLSRWTNFLESDGEKEWRDRDGEFEEDTATRTDILHRWKEGWDVFLGALDSLSEGDLEKTIYIRNQGHSVVEAINRQLAHYPYHIGQMVFIGKMCAQEWTSLSIPKGNSGQYNADKFAKDRHKAHFTDEFLNPKKDPSE